MAKGKSRSGGTTQTPLTRSTRVPLGTLPTVRLTQIQDLRAFDPEPELSPARDILGRIASVTGTTPKKQTRGRSRVPFQLAFKAPKQTLVCIRRKTRKQVLFAKRKTGKGGQRRARWSKWSSVKC